MKQQTILLTSLLFFLLSACGSGPENLEKPNTPAAPEAITLEGAPNLYKINENLYRGAQPTAEGFQALEKMGIKTVLNLRSFHSDKDELKGTDLRYISVEMAAYDMEEEDIIDALNVLTNEENFPVFVHCQHGADRTGAVIAMYRIIIDGWSKERAIDEMVNGGYGHHTIFGNIQTYIEKADVEKIQEKLDK